MNGRDKISELEINGQIQRRIMCELIPNPMVGKLKRLFLPVVDSSPDLITGRWLTVIDHVY